MTPSRHLTYLVTVALCLGIIVTAAQISLTPDLLAAARIVLAGAFANVVVQAVLITLGFVGLLSLCALAWDKAERRYAEHQARGAEGEAARRKAQSDLRTRGYTVLPANVDTSSLIDDSPGPLPETWRAPCGEPIRFPSSTTDRGTAA